jgi:hypothetical protein
MTDQNWYLPGTKIDQELHTWLKEKAEREKRSMTAQLIWELENLKNRELKGE